MSSLSFSLTKLFGLDFDPSRDAETPPWLAKKEQRQAAPKQSGKFHHVGGLTFRDVEPTSQEIASEWVLEAVAQEGPTHLTDAEALAVTAYKRYKLNVDVARKVKQILCDDSLSVAAKARKAGMSETVLAHYRSAINSVNSK
jgi:hypothetical protein